MIRTHVVAVVGTLVMAAGASSSVAAGGVAPARAATASVAALGWLDEQAASEKAAATGERVLLPARTTEREVASVNPDGTTTVEVAAEPVRARVGSTWRALDLRLVADGSGVIRPAVAAVPVTPSKGGSSVLATVERGGTVVSFSWPTALPAPVLEGASARYPEVQPTDLGGRTQLDHRGVRVIVNEELPWRSTAFYPGQ